MSATSTLLQTTAVNKQFGGLAAVTDLNVRVDEGEVVGLIGPNGAGKTTSFNLITGVYTPTSGTVTFAGQDITGMQPHRIAKLGIARTFQNIRLFREMSVIENVMVAQHMRMGANLIEATLRLPSYLRKERQQIERARELLNEVGLLPYADARSTSLPYGKQRRLEIARALATDPKLLFLDEPAAGLNPKETQEVDALVRRIADAGVTVVLVEHDMKMVMNLSERILVLDYGKKLAEGNRDEIRRNPDVIAAYLGAHA